MASDRKTCKMWLAAKGWNFRRLKAFHLPTDVLHAVDLFRCPPSSALRAKHAVAGTVRQKVLRRMKASGAGLSREQCGDVCCWPPVLMAVLLAIIPGNAIRFVRVARLMAHQVRPTVATGHRHRGRPRRVGRVLWRCLEVLSLTPAARTAHPDDPLTHSAHTGVVTTEHAGAFGIPSAVTRLPCWERSAARTVGEQPHRVRRSTHGRGGLARGRRVRSDGGHGGVADNEARPVSETERTLDQLADVTDGAGLCTAGRAIRRARACHRSTPG
jgi:hypothetical protein